MSKYLVITELVCVALVRGGGGAGKGYWHSLLLPPFSSFHCGRPRSCRISPFPLIIVVLSFVPLPPTRSPNVVFFVSSCVVQRQEEGGRKGGRRKGEEE